MHALRTLREDCRAATLVEFAMVAPVFLLLLMGSFDLGHTLYVRSTLQGALQDAGRGSGLEGGADSQQEIDDYVAAQVRSVAPKARVTFDRRNYAEFSDVGTPEDFVDANGNGVYDDDECFTDENGNGQWDSDVGEDGQGGAEDVVVYRVDVAYDRSFPLWKMIGLGDEARLSSTTTLRNQPFGTQEARVSEQICP